MTNENNDDFLYWHWSVEHVHGGVILTLDIYTPLVPMVSELGTYTNQPGDKVEKRK